MYAATGMKTSRLRILLPESTLSQKGQAGMSVKVFQKALREYESALPMTLRHDSVSVHHPRTHWPKNTNA